MVDSKDSVVWREKYPIGNGIADGHVYVDEKITGGDYSLEGYHRYSFRNDTKRILSAHKIRVVKNIAQNNQRTDKGERKSNLRFDLFPEGGNLISGLSSGWLSRLQMAKRLSGRCGRYIV